MADIDIKALQKTIDSRKKELTEKRGLLGENTVVPITSDAFLRELIHSTNTGQETGASIKIKTVDQVAEAKITGKAIDPSLLSHIPQTTPNVSVTPNVEATPNYNPQINNAAKIEEARNIKEAAAILDRKGMTGSVSNAGIADAIANYQNIPQVGAPMVEAQKGSMLTEQQVLTSIANGTTTSNAMTPNGLIVEQVTNMARQILDENFGVLYTEAMKNSIIESYKTEKVRDALQENRDMIKEIVVETIIELQKRNKSKK